MFVETLKVFIWIIVPKNPTLKLMETLVHKEELRVFSEALNWKDRQDG